MNGEGGGMSSSHYISGLDLSSAATQYLHRHSCGALLQKTLMVSHSISIRRPLPKLLSVLAPTSQSVH